jgi:hypothetical protein
LRRAFILTLKSIALTGNNSKCDLIIQSGAQKWLFLLLRGEVECAYEPIKRGTLSRSCVSVSDDPWWLAGPDDFNSIISRGIYLCYGEEPVSSFHSTASLCCQVVTLLASQGLSRQLFAVDMCDAILNLMAAHQKIPRLQFEGLKALVELLENSQESIGRLLSPTSTTSLSIFSEETARNPYSINSHVATNVRDIFKQATFIILDSLNNDNGNTERYPKPNPNSNPNLDSVRQERRIELAELLERYKKLELDHDSNCAIS